MFMQLIGSLQLGLLYTAMALGVYIAFRVLNTPDLTIDGSFTFGMAVCGMVTVAGHPVFAVLAGVLAGGLAGLVTGFLQTKLLIHPILAGILTMTGLYTVNLFVLGGRSNVSLVGKDTVFTLFNKLSPLQAEYNKFILALLLMVLLIALLAVFFKTRPGISIRATGDNEEMVRSLLYQCGRGALYGAGDRQCLRLHAPAR